MISFRLSADEYERFRELCSTCGTRSVSELARAAIHSLLKQPAQIPSEGLASRLADLEGQVNLLRLELTKLRQEPIRICLTGEPGISRSQVARPCWKE